MSNMLLSSILLFLTMFTQLHYNFHPVNFNLLRLPYSIKNQKIFHSINKKMTRNTQLVENVSGALKAKQPAFSSSAR